MKKTAIFLMSVCLAAVLTSCEDDNKEITTSEILSGFYTINGGNKSAKIPASITAYDYATGTSTDVLDDAFFAANNIAIGDGAQQALIYGSKMYIAMYTSNLIWVVEPETLKILGSIKPEGDAQSPRYLAAKNGKVYATMYTGYVSEIDTTTFKIERSVKVGPNPDQFAVAGNTLVVANSDGMNSKAGYPNSSVSVVDLASFTQTEIKCDKIYNPTDVSSNGVDAFVINKGNYKDPDEEGYIPSTVVKITGSTEDNVKYVCDGTMIDVCGNDLYVIDAPYYGKPENRTFKVYDVNTFAEKGNIAKQIKGEKSEILWPNGVFVDPVSNDIVMISYYLGDNGKALTKDPAYANVYDKAGNFKTRVECGIGARSVTFVHEKVAK